MSVTIVYEPASGKGDPKVKCVHCEKEFIGSCTRIGVFCWGPSVQGSRAALRALLRPSCSLHKRFIFKI